MKKVFGIAALLLLSPLSGWSSEPDQAALKVQGLEIAQRFVSQLKPTLKSAMQSGGPVHAIDVCSEQAPAIAANLSAQTGWSVKRVSLKARNASTAQPDAWEREQLLAFDRRAAGKQALAPVSAMVEGEFRLMLPQLAGGICLTCHGDTIAPPVQAALDQYYPADVATGYQLGQVRGAISLRWILSE